MTTPQAAAQPAHDKTVCVLPSIDWPGPLTEVPGHIADTVGLSEADGIRLRELAAGFDSFAVHFTRSGLVSVQEGAKTDPRGFSTLVVYVGEFQAELTSSFRDFLDSEEKRRAKNTKMIYRAMRASAIATQAETPAAPQPAEVGALREECKCLALEYAIVRILGSRMSASVEEMKEAESLLYAEIDRLAALARPAEQAQLT